MNEWFAKLQAEFILNFVEDNRWKYLVTGLGNTLKITLAAVLLGIVIGTLVAMALPRCQKWLTAQQKWSNTPR